MIRFLLRLVIYALAVFIAAHLLPGVDVENYWVAILVATILTLLNVTLKPFLIFLTIPITIFTLGLFLLVINTLLILIAGYLINGFLVDGFWWALLFSIILSLINSLFLAISGENLK